MVEPLTMGILGSLALSGLSALWNVKKQYDQQDAIRKSNAENLEHYQQNKTATIASSLSDFDQKRAQEAVFEQEQRSALSQSKLMIRQKRHEAKGSIKARMRAGTSMDYSAMMQIVDEQADKEMQQIEQLYNRQHYQKHIRIKSYMSKAINRINSVPKPKGIPVPDIDYVSPALSFGAAAMNSYTNYTAAQEVKPMDIPTPKG